MNTPGPAHELEQLIAAHLSIVDFGSPSTARGDEWITRAESTLERPPPASYRWFLGRYGGGEIGGEEIYSIYGIPFATTNGGDIVFQHFAHRASGFRDDLSDGDGYTFLADAQTRRNRVFAGIVAYTLCRFAGCSVFNDAGALDGQERYTADSLGAMLARLLSHDAPGGAAPD